MQKGWCLYITKHNYITAKHNYITTGISCTYSSQQQQQKIKIKEQSKCKGKIVRKFSQILSDRFFRTTVANCLEMLPKKQYKWCNFTRFYWMLLNITVHQTVYQFPAPSRFVAILLMIVRAKRPPICLHRFPGTALCAIMIETIYHFEI